jgi:hypothetical protein
LDDVLEVVVADTLGVVVTVVRADVVGPEPPPRVGLSVVSVGVGVSEGVSSVLVGEYSAQKPSNAEMAV